MSAANLVRVPSLKSVQAFRAHLASLGTTIPCDDQILDKANSPLHQPIETPTINGKKVFNRLAVQPMEGWDATTQGKPTEEVIRRWKRFGESGASLILGGEAMAVRPDGRANPNQLIISQDNENDLRTLVHELRARYAEIFGNSTEPIVGFQLTHSGRFCRPEDKKRLEPRIAYRHPILDRKFNIPDSHPILTDEEVEDLINAYVTAAEVAAWAGADFVDIKHCHGYLLHEFLGAHTRPGKFGGSFENRTRILRSIVGGIREKNLPLDIAVRLSAFDFVPFRPDPARSTADKMGPGIPESYEGLLPYKYAFGVNENNPLEPDLTETKRFVSLCGDLGIKLINLSAGSPYYNPHIQRPAAYPPSDGYQPAYDPLIDVARQIHVVKELKASAPKGMIIAGAAYSYLQEYLLHTVQALVREGWVDVIGLGRMMLSYPGIFQEGAERGSLSAKSICRTFSDCTTAPRNGLVSGCYPLDKYYSTRPEYQTLKEIKKRFSGRA